MFESLFPSHWTTLKKLMWLKLKGASAVWSTITGNPVSFTAKAAPLRQLEVAFSPVQEGTGDPSPDNVRPISGWSSLTVEQRGVNLWDGEWENGNISDNTGQNSGTSSSYFRSKNYCKMPSNTDLYWYSPYRSGNFRQYFYDKDFNYLGHRELGWNRVISVTGYDWAKDIAYFRFRVSASYDDTYDSQISVNYPTTVHEYVPYNSSGRSISITLGQTVYSGTVDVVTGVVTVDKTLRVFDGSVDESWGVNASGGLYAFNIPNLEENKVNRAPLCNMFKGKSPTAYKNLANGECASTASPHNYINFKTDLCSTVEAWRTYLSEHNIQILQFVATPLTIQLTPQEVSSLLGENNMWSDANGDLTVTYAADPATTPIVGKGKVGQAVI